MKKLFDKLTSLGGVISLLIFLCVFGMAIWKFFGLNSEVYPLWIKASYLTSIAVTCVVILIWFIRSLKVEKGKMKTNEKTIQLTCLVLILIITGCAPMKVIDTVQSETPKGYVEFYFLRGEGNPGCYPEIYSIVDNKEVFEGSVFCWGGNKVNLRIAKTPGTYTFSVQLLKYNYTFPIQIEEGMITPIRIVFEDVYKRSYSRANSIVTRSFFKMGVYPEKTVLIIEYDKKERR
ncbi:MAG: hypothetical protein ABIE36_01700 [Candidatus Diapherotrites archaeon]